MTRAVGLCGTCVNVLMAALFGFLVSPAISVEEKDSSAVESNVYPLLGSALDQ